MQPRVEFGCTVFVVWVVLNYGIVPQGIVFVVFVVFKNRWADAFSIIRLFSCLILVEVVDAKRMRRKKRKNGKSS